MDDKIIVLLTQLHDVIISSTEKIKVCTPSTDYYSSNAWCEDTIKYIDPDRLSQEILDIIKTYET